MLPSPGELAEFLLLRLLRQKEKDKTEITDSSAGEFI